jgi:mono/diheme cytochrome c family protein
MASQATRHDHVSLQYPSMEGAIVVQPGGAVAAQMFAGKPIEQYYTDSCGGCHGPHREGATGPALVPERLTDKDELYFDTIKKGRPGTVMPAWGATGLSDEEIWVLVGYIRSNDHSPYVWADSMFAKPANHIYVFDKNPPFTVVKVIEEGTQPLHPEFTADGRFVYVADWQDNLVRVYSATTFEKVAEISGIEAPSGIFNSSRGSEPLGH